MAKQAMETTGKLKTNVLLHHFPASLHRAMKVRAARDGVSAVQAYTSACRLFLKRLAQ